MDHKEIAQLAATLGIDESVAIDASQYVTAYVQSAVAEGMPLSEGLIMHAMTAWKESRARIHERYVKDEAFREEFKGHVVDALFELDKQG